METMLIRSWIFLGFVLFILLGYISNKKFLSSDDLFGGTTWLQPIFNKQFAYLQFPSKYIHNQLLLTSTTGYFNIGRKLNNINPIKDELENGEGKLSQDSISNYLGIESNFNNSDHLKKEINHDKANVFGFKDEGTCDLTKGNWVHDIRKPLYSASCPFIESYSNCEVNGRPDSEFINWKWKPKDCELPQINPKAFMESMRGQSIAFVGDSVNRNHFQSLLCILSQVEKPITLFTTEIREEFEALRHNHGYLFRSFALSLSYYWSNFLVQKTNKFVLMNDNTTQNIRHIDIDIMDRNLVQNLAGIDILIISTAHWYLLNPMIILERNQVIGGHNCKNVMGMIEDPNLLPYAYKKVIHNVLKGLLSTPQFKGTLLFRSLSPDHFGHKSYDTGGSCNFTTPLKNPIYSHSIWMYNVQLEEFLNVYKTLDSPRMVRLKFLDITYSSQLRGDGHPNNYRYSKEVNTMFMNDVNFDRSNDCVHWCLPGPIDMWNDILVETLRLIKLEGEM
ncbi:hypothetical protein BDL97_13G011600 [Sphagnum fallax]|nr:hypothetical protein BDL97_13G011600 [Sphagnum fallax]